MFCKNKKGECKKKKTVKNRLLVGNRKEKWRLAMENIKTHHKSSRRLFLLSISAILITLLCMGMLSTPVNADSDLTINKGTAYVYTATGLKIALENSSINHIQFERNIYMANPAQATINITPKRASSDLTIDGNGYLLSEYYVPTLSSKYGIKLKKAGTLDNIIVKNMTIRGGNAYGLIEITIPNVSQRFENVTYNGPKLVHNPKGAVIFKDSNITITNAHGTGTVQHEVAEAFMVTLSGKVDIVKTNNTKSTYTIFEIERSDGEIRVSDNADVTIYNRNAIRGGFADGSAHDFVVGDNASFYYDGTKTFYGSSSHLSNFRVGENAHVDIDVNSKLERDVIDAHKEIEIGQEADVDIFIDGDNSGQVFHGDRGINLGEKSSVNIDIKGQNLGTTVYAPSGNINLKAAAKMVVNTDGKLGHPIMKIGKNLNVGLNAILDLIANDNNNSSHNYVFYAAGSSSKVTYNKPERVLFFNDSKNPKSTKTSFAAYMGSTTVIDFDVWSTRYWDKANRSGGPNVLNNESRDWTQTPDNYQVKAITSGSSRFSSFTVNNYNDRMISSEQYFFGKTYEVALWQGNYYKPV